MRVLNAKSKLERNMVRNNDITLSDVKRILRGYWWVALITTTICAGAGIALAQLLPKRYTSETVILVEQPTVPTEYVKPIITEDLNRRLASMQEQILSRTRLQPIIEKFSLYPKDQDGVYTDEVIARLRAAVKITPMEPMAGTDNRQLPGFEVAVESRSPELAQEVCSEIMSMFLEQNTQEREQQASRTTSFLTKQLDEAKTKLDEQDARLAQFKRQYLGSLPEEEQTNLSLLTGLNSQLEANTQALSRAHQDLAFNESLLSQQETNWRAAQTGQNPETADLQLNALRDQLANLLSHYTPKHPDVVKVQNQIAELEKRRAAEPQPESTEETLPQRPAPTSPQVQQLRAKVRQDQIMIADFTKHQTLIEAQIHALQDRVQASPVVEQQLKELTRSYQSALDFYNELLKKRQNSAMAADLEHQQESEQFRVLDPPSLPDKASFPNKPLFAGGGLAAGLGLSLGLLYLIAFSDTSLHTERDVEKCLKLPVMVSIPTLEMDEASNSYKGPGRLVA
jgi:polysaccharide chain length determinant protein (PEP-CTERM system associated)